MRADAIVVGGGTAGAVVAARLANSGRRVLLFEAGPDYGPLEAGRWPEDLLNFASLPTSHDWGYAGFGAGGQPLLFDRAKVIGGCSTHNGCTQSAGWADDWDAVAQIAGDQWSAANIAGLVRQIAATMQFVEYAPEDVQPFHETFLRACAQHGLPRANDFLDLDGGAGAGVAPVNAPSDVRFNTAMAYLDPIRSLLTVVPNATVHRVVFDATAAAQGVEYVDHGTLQSASAPLVVVCAGAYGSPELLLRSGVGPSSQLRSHGIDVVCDLAGVGENLHDHPTAQLEFEGTLELANALAAFAQVRTLPEEQSIAKLASPFADGPYDLHVYPWVERDSSCAHGWKVVIPISQLRPRSRGRVRLRSADPSILAEIDPGYLSDPGSLDVQSLVFGTQWVLEHVVPDLAEYLGPMIGTLPPGSEATRTTGSEATKLPRWSDDSIAAWIRASHTHYWHPAGSLKIGADSDPLGVLDGAGRVRGTQGLHVADASVFPMIPRCTPALPTVVVGEIVGAALADS